MAGTKAKKVTLTIKNRNSRSKRPSRRRNDESIHEDDNGDHDDSGRALDVVRQDGEAPQPLEEPNAANSDLEKEFAAMKGEPN